MDESTNDFGLFKWTAPVITSVPGTTADGDRGEIRECLDRFMPPREFLRGGVIHTQYANSTPVSMSDVKRLGVKCEQAFRDSGAKETGICDTRWAIYQELFNELIRQEVIKCTESGKLLAKVRDEGRMTVDYLRRLYESAAAYSIKKVLKAEEINKELDEKKTGLLNDNYRLEEHYSRLLEKYESSETEYEDMKRELELKHLREIEYLAQINEEVKEQLRTLVPSRSVEDPKSGR